MYIINCLFIINCFRQIFGMSSHVFPFIYVGSFVLKGCVTDKKVADCAEIDEMLSTVISNITSKSSNTIVTDRLFDLFFHFAVPIPS